jgi:transposase
VEFLRNGCLAPSILSKTYTRFVHFYEKFRLERCRALGLLTARGQQRTDSTPVLAAIRVLNRLELVAETLRAALNAVATVAPAWLQAVPPLAWYERDSQRIEESRPPKDTAAREAYA